MIITSLMNIRRSVLRPIAAAPLCQPLKTHGLLDKNSSCEDAKRGQITIPTGGSDGYTCHTADGDDPHDHFFTPVKSFTDSLVHHMQPHGELAASCAWETVLAVFNFRH